MNCKRTELRFEKHTQTKLLSIWKIIKQQKSYYFKITTKVEAEKLTSRQNLKIQTS